MQVRLRLRFGTGNLLQRSCVSKARNAGEITNFVCLEGGLLEWLMFTGFVAPRARKISTYLGMSRVKRSLWKPILYWECLVGNARFVSSHFHFLRMSRVKRSFWKSTFHFLRMSRVKRSFWESTFSFFANVSCETLVLEVDIFIFCECLV